MTRNCEANAKNYTCTSFTTKVICNKTKIFSLKNNKLQNAYVRKEWLDLYLKWFGYEMNRICSLFFQIAYSINKTLIWIVSLEIITNFSHDIFVDSENQFYFKEMSLKILPKRLKNFIWPNEHNVALLVLYIWSRKIFLYFVVEFFFLLIIFFLCFLVNIEVSSFHGFDTWYNDQSSNIIVIFETTFGSILTQIGVLLQHFIGDQILTNFSNRFIHVWATEVCQFVLLYKYVELYSIWMLERHLWTHIKFKERTIEKLLVQDR